MDLVRIFADQKGLLAVHYDDENTDEYDRLMELWHDPVHLTGFFDSHKEDLQKGFWGNITVTEAVLTTMGSASAFDDNVKQSLEDGELDILFKQLDDLQTTLPLFSKSKAKRHWLRLYALRVDDNYYVITGGAIKLTHKMSQAEHTEQELIKINKVKCFLQSEGIVDAAGCEEVIVDL